MRPAAYRHAAEVQSRHILQALAPSCLRHLGSLYLTRLGLSFEIDLSAIACSWSVIGVWVYIGVLSVACVPRELLWVAVALTWVPIYTLFSMELQRARSTKFIP